MSLLYQSISKRNFYIYRIHHFHNYELVLEDILVLSFKPGGHHEKAA